jgi:hypothetical protein
MISIIIGYCVLTVFLYYKVIFFLVFIKKWCLKNKLQKRTLHNYWGMDLLQFVVLIIFAYSIGPGIVPQIYISSFYKKKHTRDLAYFGCIIINWSVIFLVKCVIQYTDEYFNNYIFIFFALSTFISMLFVIVHVPKWKNN